MRSALVHLALIFSTLVFLPANALADAATASQAVLKRELPLLASRVSFQQISTGEEGRDVYEYECQGGKLSVQGSSGVAMCRGVYDYLREKNLGMVTWDGTRLDLPAKLPDAERRRVVTPFEHRFYLNVVTYGYTMPYWTWERWQRELDWMALHGINMPLSFVGAEAIGQRVFKQVGLTQPEMDGFYCGPAHLPWMRMGNVEGLDGPLPSTWNEDQVNLEHKILDRMHELSIEPIVPAFAGFVPKAIQRLYPDVKLHESAWGGMPKSMHAFMLPPDSKPYAELAAKYIHEWEHEFGKAKYFSADSFNEMELPKETRSVPAMLADYGEAQYRSLIAGDPDAVWVLQGWMLGYQRQIWTPDNLQALLSRIPDDRMLILDEACDYNKVFWNNGYNFEHFSGFYGKPWIWGVIPNMGGKTAYTGSLAFYASGLGDALHSTNRGNLAGMGFAPEGIENNEVIYELLADQAWRDHPIELSRWLQQYCVSRYGDCPSQVDDAWKLLQQTCYGTFTDHPRFSWQTASFGDGTVNHDANFSAAVAQFLSARSGLAGSSLYRADGIELAAIALSLRAEEYFKLASQSLNAGTPAEPLFDRAIQCLDHADQLLTSHPIDRLDRWIEFARAHGTTVAEKDQYEENARRIITVWGPPINDYSARMWSGLIRDFYIPRMTMKFRAMQAGHPFNRAIWEEQWVRGHGVSPRPQLGDPLATAEQYVTELMSEKVPVSPARDSIGTWSPDQISEEYAAVEWPLSVQQLRKMTGVEFVYTSGAHRLDIRSVVVIADGKEIARDDHVGFAGTPSEATIYRLNGLSAVNANNGCILRAFVKGNGGHDSRGYVAVVASSSLQN